MDAPDWTLTTASEPPDGVLIEWETAAGGVVQGYRMGRRGGGLWVEPVVGYDVVYHVRPARWRPVPSRTRPLRRVVPLDGESP